MGGLFLGAFGFFIGLVIGSIMETNAFEQNLSCMGMALSFRMYIWRIYGQVEASFELS